MNELLIQYLNGMLEMEEQGHIEEALVLAEKISEIFFENRDIVLFEKGKLEFRNGYEKDALISFMEAYKISEKDEIFELILEAYYLPNKQKMEEFFLNNKKMLINYPYYRNTDVDEEILEIFPIWQDDQMLICVDGNNKRFIIENRDKEKKMILKSQALLVVNEFWIDNILGYIKYSGIEEPFLDKEYPIYLVYDEYSWKLLIQLFDLKELLKTKRIVFLVGLQRFIEYFNEDMVMFPDNIIRNGHERKCELLLNDIKNKKIEGLYKNREENINYYKKANIDKNIKSGKPKILFITTRFSTALQYSIRDCIKAIKKLGCKIELLIEPDGIHRNFDIDIAKFINRFKPDIVFIIDHFRFEFGNIIPEEVIWVTWIQDILPHIMDKETPSKLTSRDFVINCFTTWKEIKEIGYPFSRTMLELLVADNTIYKTYELTDKERKEYEADICMVCHASDVDSYIIRMLQPFEKDKLLKEMMEQLLYDYCQLIISEGFILYNKEEIHEFIKIYIKRFYNAVLPNGAISYLVNEVYSYLNLRIYRQAIADWLIEAGYRNLKLWGNGWEKNPKYKPYAMGVAQNGEVLSKILQSTKIVLGNNYFISGAMRAWESMLSGAFYMGNYIPQEADLADIREILKEGENFIMFYNKKDLLDKVDYYLSHENERKQIAEKGRQVVLKTRTFDVLMKKLLVFLSRSL